MRTIAGNAGMDRGIQGKNTMHSSEKFHLFCNCASGKLYLKQFLMLPSHINGYEIWSGSLTYNLASKSEKLSSRKGGSLGF